MSRYEEVAEDGLITAVLQQLFQRAPRPHPVLQAMQIDEEERKKPVHELTLKEVRTLFASCGLEVQRDSLRHSTLTHALFPADVVFSLMNLHGQS